VGLRKLFIVLALLAMGCGAAQTAVRPLVAEDRRPEARELPIDVRDELLPDGTPTEPGEDYVMPVTAGECIPEHGMTVPPSDEEQVIPGPCPTQDGILVSEARANRDALYRVRYRELRDTAEADRRVWSAHRELYEAQIAADREEIANLQPTWWERHDGTVLTAVGVVVGAMITVAITFAVNQASE
jgi:hypothetical protein